METEIRNRHAFRLFDIVLSVERNNGKSLDEARTSAYDAVELRYGISTKTLQNYMTKERTSGHFERAVFEQENIELIDLLQTANQQIVSKIQELQDMLSRNNRLLELLKEADANIHRPRVAGTD